MFCWKFVVSAYKQLPILIGNTSKINTAVVRKSRLLSDTYKLILSTQRASSLKIDKKLLRSITQIHTPCRQFLEKFIVIFRLLVVKSTMKPKITIFLVVCPSANWISTNSKAQKQSLLKSKYKSPLVTTFFQQNLYIFQEHSNEI